MFPSKYTGFAQFKLQVTDMEHQPQEDIIQTEEVEQFMLIDDDNNLEWLNNLDMFDNVFKIHGLLLENSRPDYETITLDDQKPDKDMLEIIERHFGSEAEYIQIIFKNNHDKQECQACCPYFRVFMNTVNNKTPINYKLENFLKRCKSPWTQVRCEKALVFGIFSATDMSRFASVPFEFQNYFESQCGLKLDADTNKTTSFSLSGNKPFLPDEIYGMILRFIIHPCAQLIKQYWKSFDAIWDYHFDDMKQAWKRYNLHLL